MRRSHSIHKLSQRRLTADCLAPRESDCSRMGSKVSPDWLLSYIKATRPVLEIFKMAGYFPDRRPIYLLPLHEHLPPKEIKEGVENLHIKGEVYVSNH